MKNVLPKAIGSLLFTLFVLPKVMAANCSFEISNEWGSGYTAAVTITNDTQQTIDGWSVSMSFSDASSISSIWNASVSNDSPYQASNLSYNAKIATANSTTFGLNVNKGTADTTAVLPTLGNVCSEVDPEPIPTDPLSCSYTIVNEWNSGFTASLKITNDTPNTINGWAVGLKYTDNSSITGAWDSTLTGSNPYSLKNVSYNRSIAPNQSVQLGFNGQKAIAGQPASTPTLSNICGITTDVNTQPTAVAQASSLQGAVPFKVNFNADGSTDPDNDNLTYTWSFGDGTSSNLVAPEKTFETAQTYVVTLTVNDGELDSDPVTLNIKATAPQTLQAFKLDPAASSLHFVSTKKVHVVETHSFVTLGGEIDANGTANLTIDLSSVETGIDVRNQRMRDFLFETVDFPQAQISLNIDMTQLSNLAVGNSMQLDISPTLDLHGVTSVLNSQVKVTRLSETKILVQNVSPILIQAADYDLTAGIETLRELASLTVISYAVPSNFTLFFNAQ